MSVIPFGFGMDPLFGDFGGFGSLGGGWPTSGRRSVFPSSGAGSTALAPMDDRQLLDFGRLAADPLPVDVEDREHEYLIRVHQREAGMRKKDLRVDVENGLLTIRGERESESGEPTSGHYSRRYRSVTRSMALPDNVDERKIEARYEGNNLMVHVPKMEGAAGGRRSIQIGGVGHAQGAGQRVGQGQGQAEHKEAEKPQGVMHGQGQGQGPTSGPMHGQAQAQGHAQTQAQMQM